MKEKEVKWQNLAKNLIRKSMAEKNMNLPQLARVMETDTLALKAKIRRGTFSAAFLLQALKTMGAKDLDIELFE